MACAGRSLCVSICPLIRILSIFQKFPTPSSMNQSDNVRLLARPYGKKSIIGIYTASCGLYIQPSE